jgi:hypothetical protein
MFGGSIRETRELSRILALPRRRLDDPAFDTLVPEMTELLRRPEGTMTLRRVQALALYEIATHRGGFCSVGVGEGKTLISLLAPFVLGAQRPLLLLPAGLVQKTDRDRDELARHWLIPTNIRLFSYEMLGREQAAAELDVYCPDLIVADETQKLKNYDDAACARRVARYLETHPETMFVALSGTIMSRSLTEFGHILRWCLKGDAPIPKTTYELSEWANALDERIRNELERPDPGALLKLAEGIPGSSGDELTRARRGFQRRLIETPGVVATTGRSGESVDCSIYVKAIEYPLEARTVEYFGKLRTEMLTPDDWQLFQPVDVWRHARELALGLHYVWDPRPPEEWRIARRNWHAFVRDVLAKSDALDSDAQVATACDAGHLPDDALRAWRAIKDTFVPNTVAVWHDDGPIRKCIEWMRKPGLVWTEHALFAERLARMSGCTYYGRKGLSEGGEFIDDAPNTRAIIVSVDANREGRNLQKKWSRNLVVSPPDGSDVWQQLLGRTHRPGQTADEVIVDVFLGCLEHVRAWQKARAGALAVRDTTGAEQKLLLADVEWPSDFDLARRPAPRWKAPEAKPFVIPSAA